MNELVTLDEVQRILPKKKGLVTQEAVDILNNSLNDPEFQAEGLIDLSIQYQDVIDNKKYSLVQYLKALKFCTFVNMPNATTLESYKRVFSEKKFVKERWNAPPGSREYKDLTSASSRYKQSELVVSILTVSQLPLHMMFSSERFKALRRLAIEMDEAKLSRDRINAAKELLVVTAPPAQAQLQINIGNKASSALDALNEQLESIASKSISSMKAGNTSLDKLGAMSVEAHVINEDE